ncbi:MAG: RlmE family RNA methyltransferase [Pseudomonadota bacterium]|nr:RlmE family RNA methyltransferase [Pseudomonadota bacterium]MDE3038627.1 RlmE family RNA methyltransferase [Pseudomonadota bacterium]
MAKPFSGKRTLKTRVKTARKRSNSSTRWLERQLNDPYVKRARQEGYRSRAAYKLIELDDRFKFLKPGKTVLDLGAAPGGWTQVAVAKSRSLPDAPRVIAVDILPMPGIPGAVVLQLDFLSAAAPQKIRALLPDGVDMVLSDMAPNTIGHTATDHLRIVALLEAAYPFACEVLKPGGVFIAKVFQGGAERELLARMKKDFDSVRHAKPKASRSGSSEMYVAATGFKGHKNAPDVRG